jgi:DNA-binding transcriptional ArsR family regulator
MKKEDMQERKQKWLKKLEEEGKLTDPKEDHSRGLRALQNPTRREVLKFIGDKIVPFRNIKSHFNLDKSSLRFHLTMLEQALYIEQVNNDWRLTPRGIGYLKIVEPGK